MLSPERIKSLRKQLLAASKVPWQWINDNGVDMPRQWRIAPGILLVDGDCGTPGGDQIDRANAALIITAVNELEPLLDEVERLRKALGEISEDLEKYEDQVREKFAGAESSAWRNMAYVQRDIARQALMDDSEPP